MATLALTAASVLADGRIVRLDFAVDPVPAAFGVPDWRPGWAAGARLTLSTGATLEFIGAWANPYDLPVADVLIGTAGDAGTTPVPGVYHVAYSFVRTSDGEEFFGPVVTWTVEAAGDTFKLVLGFGTHAIPAGHTANVYVSTPDGGPGTMALYRTGIAPAVSYDTAIDPPINDRVWDAPGTAWPGPARLNWTGTWLVTDPAEVVTISEDGLTVTGGAGLLQDAHGNATAAFTTQAATNRSVVDADGFTSDSFTRGTTGVTVYVSSTHGDDGRDLTAAQDPTTPVATALRAFNLLYALPAATDGSAIRFLRGDTIPMGGHIWLQYFGGPDKLHPAVFESYWDASFGADPGTRPILTGYQFAGQHQGGYSHVVIRGLHLTNGMGFNPVFGVNDLTVDDNLFTTSGNGFGGSRGVTFLRNVFRDIYNEAGDSAALYMASSADVLLSQNAFDFVGRTTADLTGSAIRSHALYHQYDNRPLVMWGNLVREGGSHGLHMRAGGVAAYNVFTRCAIGVALAQPGGTLYRNVVEKGRDISGGTNRGFGLELLAVNEMSPALGPTHVAVESNFIVNEESAGEGVALNFAQIAGFAMPEVIVRNNTISRAGPVYVNHWDSPDTSEFTYESSRNILHADAGLLLYTNVVAGGWAWYESDANLLAPPDNGTGQTNLGTLATWKATTGSEAASVEAAPAFVDGTADLGDFHAPLGGDGTEATYITAARDRAAGAWGDAFEMRRAWTYYGTRYRPSAEPSGTGAGTWDYYGAADYRATAAVRRRSRGRRRV